MVRFSLRDSNIAGREKLRSEVTSVLLCTGSSQQ